MSTRISWICLFDACKNKKYAINSWFFMVISHSKIRKKITWKNKSKTSLWFWGFWGSLALHLVGENTSSLATICFPNITGFFDPVVGPCAALFISAPCPSWTNPSEQTFASWWLFPQPVWNICASQIGSSPQVRVKIPKMFELPPPSLGNLDLGKKKPAPVVLFFRLFF